MSSLGIHPPLLWRELLVLVSAVAGVAAHEAGHSLAGHWAGLPARMVQIGTGPTLARWHFGRFVVVVGFPPLNGFSAGLPQPNASPGAYAIKLAGGPAANALLFGLIAACFFVWPTAGGIIEPLLVTQGILAVVNLIPFQIRMRGQLRRSDGLQLLRYALGRLTAEPFDYTYRATIAWGFPVDAPLPPPSADAPELLFNCWRPDRWLNRWARQDARAEVATLLEAGRLTPPERALALHFLLNNELAFGDTGASDDCLLSWAEEAWLLMPHDSTVPSSVRLTRAGVLVRSGDVPGAEAMLLGLFDTLTLPASIVSCRVYLAQAAALQGRRDEAAQWLKMAKTEAVGPTRKALRRLVRSAERRPPLALVDPGGDAAINPA